MNNSETREYVWSETDLGFLTVYNISVRDLNDIERTLLGSKFLKGTIIQLFVSEAPLSLFDRVNDHKQKEFDPNA